MKETMKITLNRKRPMTLQERIDRRESRKTKPVRDFDFRKVLKAREAMQVSK